LAEAINFPELWEMVLVDKSAQVSLDLKNEGNYSFSSQNKDFRILVGQPDFVQDNDLGSQPLLKTYELFQNYPNPFNSETTIQYALSRNTHLKIVIYNALGKEVKKLVDNTYQSPGIYKILWDGTDNQGIPLPTGIYLCRLMTNEDSQIRKLLNLK